MISELEKIMKTLGRPAVLDKPHPIYHDAESVYPEAMRMSFADGKTIIYDRRVEQPAPVFEENIRIIRKWKQGYVNKPARRRRKR